MATIDTVSSATSNLMYILMADDIEPGSDVSYQLCKTIYEYHPMGKKIIDAPITMAMSKARKISVPDSPEDVATEAFNRQWELSKCDQYIAAAKRLSGIYGLSVLSYDAVNPDTKLPYSRDELIQPELLSDIDLVFHVFDPMNTAGSLVLNQVPTDIDFMRPTHVTVGGKNLHPSRCCVMMNEDPIYLSYTSSAFGFVGRSKYQRALYPLKSFIRSMITDNEVQEKAGILVVKNKPNSSIVDQMMRKASELKAAILKDLRTGNVFMVGQEDSVESLDMTNIGPTVQATRSNIIANIALSSNTPQKLLSEESFADGFGEGSEDAKNIATYIDDFRRELEPLYTFFDKIVMRKAWNKAFFASIQQSYPEEYGNMTYEAAFCRWQNSFTAEWPELIEEKEEVILERERLKLESVQGIVEKLGANLDPENKALLLEWAEDNINELKLMFPNKLKLDYEQAAAYVPVINERTNF